MANLIELKADHAKKEIGTAVLDGTRVYTAVDLLARVYHTVLRLLEYHLYPRMHMYTVPMISRKSWTL